MAQGHQGGRRDGEHGGHIADRLRQGDQPPGAAVPGRHAEKPQVQKRGASDPRPGSEKVRGPVLQKCPACGGLHGEKEKCP